MKHRLTYRASEGIKSEEVFSDLVLELLKQRITERYEGSKVLCITLMDENDLTKEELIELL